LAYPKGRRGARGEIIDRRAVALLKDLVADKSGAASRIERIRAELVTCWTQGYASACKWRDKKPQNDMTERGG
jgi:hypothetical protein